MGTAQIAVAAVKPAVVDHFQLFGVHHQQSSLALGFSGAMNPRSVTDLSHYSLVPIGPHRMPHVRPFPLASASYDPATNTVTILPARHLNIYARYRFTATGLIDAQCNPLDGDGDGVPGGEFTITFGHEALRGQTIHYGSKVPTPLGWPSGAWRPPCASIRDEPTYDDRGARGRRPGADGLRRPADQDPWKGFSGASSRPAQVAWRVCRTRPACFNSWR
jgi:hypothetical protein